MPDLLTHGCVALLVKAGTRRPHVASFVAGNLLPDLLSRVPGHALGLLKQRGLPIPDAVVYLSAPLHLPVGAALAAWLLSLLFEEAVRRAVFVSLYAGMVLHIGLDLLQDHAGVGSPLLYPFSARGFELGLIGSEDTVFFALPLAAWTAWVWRAPLRAALARRAARGGPAPTP